MGENAAASMQDNLDASRPWLALYPKTCGAELVPDCGDILSMFRQSVRRFPHKAAIVYFDRVTSYRELDAQSDAVAGWLADAGVGKGDRVCLVMQNVPAFAVICLAAWKLGAVPVPGNPMYRAGEMARIFADAEPAAVCCQDAELDEMAEALSAGGLAHIPICVVSPVEGQSYFDPVVLPAPVVTTQGQRLSTILEQYAGYSPPAIHVSPDDVGLILYTSGTTGQPKGAMLRHYGMAFNGQFIRDWCELSDEDRILCIAPFFHITGLVCHMCASFTAGCTMILNYRFEPSLVLRMIRDHRPTFTIGAITAFNALMRLPEAKAEDMVSLRRVFSGGAAIPPALSRAIRDRLGFDIYPTYGMTELTAPAVFSPFGHDVPQRDDVLSIGIPIPSTQVKIVDDDGVALAPGGVGEILVAGPQVMARYWRKPEDTAAALAGGWMHTGDVGFMDGTGWIYLVDRKKDVIIASGFKVWPREVEDVLYSHPQVREVAVIGVPDPYRGENVKACVSLVSGGSVSEAELKAHCRERLASYKIPRQIVFFDDLPKTPSGKIQRSALRESD